jgi:hypothetical protein
MKFDQAICFSSSACAIAGALVVSSALTIFGGGTLLVVGGGANILIATGDLLKPHRPTFNQALMWGTTGVASGFLAMVGAVIYGHYRFEVEFSRKLFSDEGEEAEVGDQPEPEALSADKYAIPPACVGCSHYHGYTYCGDKGQHRLICAIHPLGWHNANCPDHEPAEKSELP